MSTLFGRLVRKVAIAAVEEMLKPEHQRRAEAAAREAKAARKQQRKEEAFRKLAEHLEREFRRQARKSWFHEEVTAVLRRQIPPQDAIPRSWIGGLPKLPDDVEWPRARNSYYPDAGEMPLNFIAQIACADLPEGLWGGLGPRQGWLVFFGATWGCASFEDKGSFRCFHTMESGTDRYPPADKRSVGDPTYSGGDNTSLCYRRWPVDIVAHPNEPLYPSGSPWRGDEPVSPIPPNYATILYNNTDANTKHRTVSQEPFVWGMVATMLERALALQQWRPKRYVRPKKLSAEDVDRALTALAERQSILLDRKAQKLASDQLGDPEKIESSLEQIAQQRAILRLAGNPFDPDALAAILHRSSAMRRLWLHRQRSLLKVLLVEATAHDWDEPISLDDWNCIRSQLTASNDLWFMNKIRLPKSAERIDCPDISSLSTADLVEHHKTWSVHDGALRLYGAGPRQRSLIPEKMRKAIEEELRGLQNNRPHRLGGIFQPVQDTNAPQDKVLLLQLGTDDPTGFHWGDSGALFAWIDIESLQNGDFNNIQWWTENT